MPAWVNSERIRYLSGDAVSDGIQKRDITSTIVEAVQQGDSNVDCTVVVGCTAEETLVLQKSSPGRLQRRRSAPADSTTRIFTHIFMNILHH